MKAIRYINIGIDGNITMSIVSPSSGVNGQVNSRYYFVVVDVVVVVAVKYECVYSDEALWPSRPDYDQEH